MPGATSATRWPTCWKANRSANQTGVDLSEAFRRNLDKKTQRDADRHRNNPKLQ